MQPSGGFALGVERTFHVLHGHRVEVVVVDVILTRPLQLDRCAAHRLRDQSCFSDEVKLRLTTEAAAQQRHIHRDLLGLEADGLGHKISCALRCLCGCPDLAAVVNNAGGRHRWLHRGMGHVGQVVLGLHAACGFRQCCGRVTVIAHGLGRLAGGGFQRGFVGDRVVAGVRAVIPFKHQSLAALDG